MMHYQRLYRLYAPLAHLRGCAWLLATSLVLLMACGDKAPAVDAKAEAKKQAQETPIILEAKDMAVAEPADFVRTLSVRGMVKSRQDTLVSAETSGLLRAVLVQEGDRVRRGQVLATIDATELQAQYDAQLASVTMQRSVYRLSQQKYQKYQQLFKEGFISKVALLEYQSEYEVAAANLRNQEALLAKAKKSLSASQVTAPMDGVIYRKEVSAGDYATANKALFALADVRDLEMTATVPGDRMNQVRVGQAVAIKTLNGGEAQGQVRRINPVANDGTRAFNVYIHIRPQDHTLHIGDFVEGLIAIESYPQAITVPSASILAPETGVAQIVKLRPDDTLETVTLTLAYPMLDDARLVVLDGLQAGESYLLEKMAGIKPGRTVQRMDASPPSNTDAQPKRRP
jgi:RND family efflux transporter MFP subunit